MSGAGAQQVLQPGADQRVVVREDDPQRAGRSPRCGDRPPGGAPAPGRPRRSCARLQPGRRAPVPGPGEGVATRGASPRAIAGTDRSPGRGTSSSTRVPPPARGAGSTTARPAVLGEPLAHTHHPEAARPARAAASRCGSMPTPSSVTVSRSTLRPSPSSATSTRAAPACRRDVLQRLVQPAQQARAAPAAPAATPRASGRLHSAATPGALATRRVTRSGHRLGERRRASRRDTAQAAQHLPGLPGGLARPPASRRRTLGQLGVTRSARRASAAVVQHDRRTATWPRRRAVPGPAAPARCRRPPAASRSAPTARPARAPATSRPWTRRNDQPTAAVSGYSAAVLIAARRPAAGVAAPQRASRVGADQQRGQQHA